MPEILLLSIVHPCNCHLWFSMHEQGVQSVSLGVFAQYMGVLNSQSLGLSAFRTRR